MSLGKYLLICVYRLSNSYTATSVLSTFPVVLWKAIRVKCIKAYIVCVSWTYILNAKRITVEGRAEVAKNRASDLSFHQHFRFFSVFQIGLIMLISFLLCNCEYIGQTVASYFCAWKNKRKKPLKPENNGEISYLGIFKHSSRVGR